jgi:hypothetical protein
MRAAANRCSSIACSARASPAERGGGVYSEASSIAYQHCFFAACITNGDGGGSYDDDTSVALIDRSTFLVCSAGDGRGGALFNYGATLLVSRSVFQSSSAGDGAGVYDLKSRIDFVNCVFWPVQPRQQRRRLHLGPLEHRRR